ncbi:MAG: hypothetical protein LUH14_03185 [Clostridiaceae bacterium]|nr:hypothetical protein [Clostridiaceae bacterium]
MGYSYYAECKKVLQKRSIWFFLFILLIGYLCYLWGEVTGNIGSNAYSYQEYLALADTVDTEDLQGEAERLEQQAESFSKETLYSKNFYSETALYQEILMQIEHITGYPDYTETVLEQTQQSDISLFQKDAYTEREQKKTAADFENLQKQTLTFAPYRGVCLLADFDFADVIMLILTVLLAASLITAEKEEHTLPLLHSTFHGRRDIGAVKFFCGLLFLFAGFLILSVCKCVMIGGTYGIGNWNAAIQSVYSYASCRYTINVGTFLILTAVSRLAGCLALYAVLFLCAAFVQKGIALYSACGAFFGIEGVLFVTIPEHSYFTFLRQLNIMSFLNSETLIGNYQNINLMNYPIDYWYTALGIEVFFFFTAAILGIISFGRCREQHRRQLSGSKIWKIFWKDQNTKKQNTQNQDTKNQKVKNQKVKNQNTENQNTKNRRIFLSNRAFLFEKEVKKVWVGEKGIWLFLAGCLFLALLYSPLEESYADRDDVYYRSYMLKIQGAYSDEKLQQLYKEKDELEKIQESIDSGTEYTSAQLEILLGKTEKLTGLERAIQNAEYIKKNNLSHVIYEKGYLTLIGREEGQWEMLKLRLISLMIMVGMAAAVWGIETWSGTDKILKTSAVGERSLKRMKRYHIALLSLIIFAVTYLPWVWNVTRAYDCSQWSAFVGSILFFEGSFFAKMTLGQAAAVYFLFHLLYLLLSGLATAIIQKKTGNYFLTVFVSFIVFAIPVFLLYGINI